MKTFKEQLEAYASGRERGMNRWLQYVSVPAMMLGALILLSWVSLGLFGQWNISFAWFAIALLSAHYFRLHVKLAFVMAALLILATLFCGLIAYPSPNTMSGVLFVVLFVGGLILQFSGQPVSKDKSFLSAALSQLLIAPMYWLVEVVKHLRLEKYFDLEPLSRSSESETPPSSQ